MKDESREPFSLSLITQYGFCKRRCALLVRGEDWIENEYTAAGRASHARVHTTRVEKRGDLISLYEYRICSGKLGISGICDCLEARRSDDGVKIPQADGLFRLYPVEYKHGAVRDEWEYNLQLCAQALCLEEQYGATIPRGAVFYIDSHRRYEVELDKKLREETFCVISELSALIEGDEYPPAEFAPKCRKCSMYDSCYPKLKSTADRYIGELWKEVKEGRKIEKATKYSLCYDRRQLHFSSE